jgi:hypothetical protein
MSKTFTAYVNDCQLALGDTGNVIWDRDAVVIWWAKEAIMAFPILNPSAEDLTVTITANRQHKLPLDFREIVSVEYPIGEDPPVYLSRMNRFDPDFYNADDHFDVSRYYLDYPSYTGWVVYTSKLLEVDDEIRVHFLGNHNTDLEDDAGDLLTVPDEYVHILIAYVVMKAMRERLIKYLSSTSVFTEILRELTNAAEKSEQYYFQLIGEAISRLADSKTSPAMKLDKFDRLY